MAETLQREHGGGVADMAVGDVGLDGKDIHDGGRTLRAVMACASGNVQPMQWRDGLPPIVIPL
jgi:hypothetical protein